MRSLHLLARSRPTALGFAGVVAGVTLFAAAPAQAAPTVTVSKSGDRIVVSAGNQANGIDIRGSKANGSITVSDTLQQVGAGAGCTQISPTSVRCTTGGIVRVDVNASGGDDAVRNNTTDMPSRLSGSAGRDRLSGGGAADTILGGSGDDPFLSGGGGFDTINGGTGIDTCTGESESNCEK